MLTALPASGRESAPDTDDHHEIFRALGDLCEGRISAEEYDALNAVYESKHPQPVYEDTRAPWERENFLPNWSPALRKQQWENREAKRAKVSANWPADNSALGQAGKGFASHVLRRTPVATSNPAPRRLLSSLSALLPANRSLVAWEGLSENKKLLVIGEAAEAQGAMSITVHMSAKRQAYLRTAAAAGRDIRQIVADEVARHFRNRGLKAPALLFGIEVALTTNKIHIHGFYIPDDNSPAYFDLVRDAFTRALGKIKGQSGSTQFDCEPLYTPDRWLSYFHKVASRVRKNLGADDLLYVSNSMRRRGKNFQDARCTSGARTSNWLMVAAVRTASPLATTPRPPLRLRPGRPATPVVASCLRATAGACPSRCRSQTLVPREVSLRTSRVTRGSSKICSGPVGAT